MRRARRAALAAVIVLQGCAAYEPPPSFGQRARFGVVAVVPAQLVPQSNFATPGGGNPGAGVAAAAQVVAAGGPRAIVNLGPVLASPLAPIFVAAVAVSGAIVAIDIKLHSVPAEKAGEIETAIRQSTAALDVQPAFAARLASLLGDEQIATLQATDAPGVDTRMETAVLELRLAGCSAQTFDQRLSARLDLLEDQCPGGPRNPLLYLSVHAQVRALRAADGTELSVHRFGYRGARRTLAQWMAEDASLLHRELGRAFVALAEQAADAFFLSTRVDLTMPPAFPALPGSDPAYGLCWLAPLYPAPAPLLVSEMWTLPFTPISKRNLCVGSALHFSTLDSLQPTLRWSALPPQPESGPPTYDLRVWRVEDCVRAELVYQRRGLALPEHRLEEALAPAQRYFWTVRARFMAEGRPAASPWAFFTPGLSCFVSEIQEGQYHRFITPPGN
jgi:hypothetical protein